MAVILIAADPALARSKNLTLPGRENVVLQIGGRGPADRAAVHRAIQGAFRRLARPECQKVFADFSDAEGWRLEERLEALGQTGQDFLADLGYVDGSGTAPCASPEVLAFTYTGNRVVRVCLEQFVQVQRTDPRAAEVILIHESLHSLGLDENPPPSWAITSRVLRRCGP